MPPLVHEFPKRQGTSAVLDELLFKAHVARHSRDF